LDDVSDAIDVCAKRKLKLRLSRGKQRSFAPMASAEVDGLAAACVITARVAARPSASAVPVIPLWDRLTWVPRTKSRLSTGPSESPATPAMVSFAQTGHALHGQVAISISASAK